MSVGNFNASEMGQRIRELRKKQGLTQAEVADKLHIKRETLSTIEGGLRSLRDQEIVQITEILDTSCDYLLTGIETRNKDIHAAIHLSNKAIERLVSLSEQSKTENKDGIPNWFLPGAHDDDPASTILSGLDYLLSSDDGNKLLLLLSQYMIIDFRTGRLKLPPGYVLVQYDRMVDGERPEIKQLIGATISDETTVSVNQLTFSSLFSGKDITLSTKTFDEAMLQEILTAIRSIKVIMQGGNKTTGSINMREGDQIE